MAFYIITSQMNGLALTAEANGMRPNARVTPQLITMNDNQLFFDDDIGKTIRIKSSHFCLDIDDGQLVVRPYQPGNPNQQWVRSEPFIRNGQDPDKVIDIFGFYKQHGGKVSALDFNGAEYQRWIFECIGPSAAFGYPAGTSEYFNPAGCPAGFPTVQPYQLPMGFQIECAYSTNTGKQPQNAYPPHMAYPAEVRYPGQVGYPNQLGYHDQAGQAGYAAQPVAPPKAYQRNDFYIISELTGKVIDILTENNLCLAMVCKREPNLSKSQLWYLNEEGHIRNALNDTTFYCQARGLMATMVQPMDNPRSQWSFVELKIMNRLGEVLEISVPRDDNKGNVGVVASRDLDKKSQQWRQAYIQ